MKKWLSLALSINIAMSSAALGHECKPTFVAHAEFGPRDLATKASCPSVPPNAEQSCSLSEGGVSYGVSEGLLINKVIVPTTFAGGLPFGLTWGQKLTSVVAAVGRQGAPPLWVASPSDGGYLLSTDRCLVTRQGETYELTFFFGNDEQLTAIRGAILYP